MNPAVFIFIVISQIRIVFFLFLALLAGLVRTRVEILCVVVLGFSHFMGFYGVLRALRFAVVLLYGV